MLLAIAALDFDGLFGEPAQAREDGTQRVEVA
jgi:hypothetical protein